MRALSVAGTAVIAAITFCLVSLLTRRGRSASRCVERALAKFAERPIRASIVLFFWFIAARLLALPLFPVPTPGIHDEFSYLLGADTFAHGRLTNPSHPLWLSFETFHVNWHPTDSSMYPPAQGLILAAGQLLGHPWIGVLLSNAAMCVAIFWALRAWMPSRWALLAAAVTWFKFGLTSYWINSYWGGCVAAVGGALVLGGLGRLRRRARVRDAVAFALGVAILANSRPYEGLFFCLPAAVWFLLWLAGKIEAKDVLRSRLRKAFLPVATVLLVTIAFMGSYNWRLTGNALLLPHVMNARAYRTAGLFLWDQKKPELHYNNMALQAFYNGWERSNYQTNYDSAKRVSMEKVNRMDAVYFWSGALLILPAIPVVLMDRKMKLLWAILAVGSAAVFAVSWSLPHYSAPLTCIFYGLVVQGVRHLRTMRISSFHFGVASSRVMVLLLLLDTATNVCYGVCDPLLFTCPRNSGRAALVDRLQHLSGRHLVMVRYAELHDPHSEWVFNGADIDGAKVVWARELTPEQNANLFAYFKDRNIWLVTPDTDNTYLEPYTSPCSAASESDPDRSICDTPSAPSASFLP